MKQVEEYDVAGVSPEGDPTGASRDIEVTARFAITESGKIVLRKYDV